MELVAVNFYHGATFAKQVVALCLIQTSWLIMQVPMFLSKPSKPDNAQSKQQNWLQQQRGTVMKKTVRKEAGCFTVQRRVCQVLPAIFAVRKASRL